MLIAKRLYLGRISTKTLLMGQLKICQSARAHGSSDIAVACGRGIGVACWPFASSCGNAAVQWVSTEVDIEPRSQNWLYGYMS